MVKAIIFDLDGVIIDSENTVWKPATAEFVKNHGAVFERKKMLPLMIGRTLEDGVGILQRHYGINGDIKKLAEERSQIVIPARRPDLIGTSTLGLKAGILCYTH